eukprot:8830520-Alexandrium_andersonii.AAC.1
MAATAPMQGTAQHSRKALQPSGRGIRMKVCLNQHVIVGNGGVFQGTLFARAAHLAADGF